MASDEGDILIKLKDGKQLRIISFLIKRRSSVFKTMLESSMKEAATGVVDLSSEYSLEAFRDFIAYIYYNKLHTGSYVPLLFEILCITEYYDVEKYRTYISDRILKLITDVPICLVIAAEALKHGTLTSEIYRRCVAYLAKAMEPQVRVCYDQTSVDSKGWCCSEHSTKDKQSYYHESHKHVYKIDGKIACVYATVRNNCGYGNAGIQTSDYTQRCCLHGPNSNKRLVSADQFPEFIVDDVNSTRNGVYGG